MMMEKHIQPEKRNESQYDGDSKRTASFNIVGWAGLLWEERKGGNYHKAENQTMGGWGSSDGERRAYGAVAILVKTGHRLSVVESYEEGDASKAYCPSGGCRCWGCSKAITCTWPRLEAHQSGVWPCLSGLSSFAPRPSSVFTIPP